MRNAIFLFFICYCITAYAQNNPPEQLRFNHLFVNDGLIEGRVHPIVQDNEGYIWMGTHNGLVRYDGYQPKTYLLSGKKLNRTRISDIYVDSTGELWIGTFYNGLYRYDRRNDIFRWCTPDSANERFIQLGEINNILRDRHGNIWFVLHNKLTKRETVCAFNIRQHRFTHYGNEEKGNHHTNYSKYLSPLATDNNGNIWCGSDNGLKEYDYGKGHFKEHQTTNNPLLQKDFSMICIDKPKPHILWTAIWNNKWDKFEGVGRYDTDNGSFTIYRCPKPDTANTADDYIHGMSCDAKGNLWIVTQTSLIFFDVANKNFTHYTPPTPVLGLKSIYNFEEDAHGNFWLLINGGNIDGELAYFNTTTRAFTKYALNANTNEAESFRSPHDLYLDRSGGLWFGVGEKGVQWVNKEKSKINLHINTQNSQKDDQQSFIDCKEAPDHTIWFTTNVGLCHWYPAKDSFEWVSLAKKLGTRPLVRSTIAVDRKGCVWCGIYMDDFPGLCCYDPATKELKTYTYNEVDTSTLSSSRFATVLADHSGNIWIGTYGGGLCRFNQVTEKFTRYPHISNVQRAPNDNRLDDNDVQSLYEDKTGTLWIGTVWGSLNKLYKDSNTFISMGDKVPLLKGLLTIFEDSKNNLWAGTYTNGLFLIDRKNETATRISEKDGLLYNEIEGILEDDKGNLWLKSARGISIYNPVTKSVRNIADELLEDDILNPLSCKLSNGLFIFSTKGGFITLNANDFTPDSTTPVVHIETIVFNSPGSKEKSVDSTILRYGKQEINLSYNENRITFNYVGLMYQNTSQIRYRYKLEGYDNDWVDANTQRTVTYTNLSPGTYAFHVLAANSDGIWSRQADAITIVIAPAFWETWWFRILVIAAITALSVQIVKAYLNRRLRAQQREFERLKAIDNVRSKISMDIHDEISSGLTKISLLSQRVKTKYENNKEVEPEIIDKIAGSSKEVISNLGEIIWAVNPRHDNLQSLLAYIRNYASTFLESTSIEPYIHFPEEALQISVSPDVKHNLFLVVKEALNNVVKHAEATRVNLDFNYTADSYTLTIADNGKGITNLNGRTFGNGLVNMRKRMEAINGTFAIRSEENKGTQLQLKGRFRVEKV